MTSATDTQGHVPPPKPSMIQSVCLYCGSRPGSDPAHAASARDFGAGLALRGLTLVYGGGSIGLMGIAARAALDGGGQVVGIIPDFLNRDEIGLAQCSELIVVGSMHARKMEMFDRSDAFVVLPGGIGTLDEMVEVITWAQLKLHDRPIFLVNDVFWQPFLALIDHFISAGFIGRDLAALFRPVKDIAALWPLLEAAPAPREAAISGRI